MAKKTTSNTRIVYETNKNDEFLRFKNGANL